MLADENGVSRRWTTIRLSARKTLQERRKIVRAGAVLTACAMFSAVSGAEPTKPGALDLAQHRGRVVIVDFWASWCKPCRQSIPWLNAMRVRYASQGLDVIGVNVDAEHADAVRFLRDVPIEFEVVFDPRGELAKAFKVQGMPSSFVFDRSGKLVQTHLGFRDAKKDENETALKDLLQPAK